MTWKCEKCEVINLDDALICVVCNKEKPAGIEPFHSKTIKSLEKKCACGRKIFDSTEWVCPNCGNPQYGYINCPKCGKLTYYKGNFCRNCGRKLIW